MASVLRVKRKRNEDPLPLISLLDDDIFPKKSKSVTLGKLDSFSLERKKCFLTLVRSDHSSFTKPILEAGIAVPSFRVNSKKIADSGSVFDLVRADTTAYAGIQKNAIVSPSGVPLDEYMDLLNESMEVEPQNNIVQMQNSSSLSADVGLHNSHDNSSEEDSEYVYDYYVLENEEQEDLEYHPEMDDDSNAENSDNDDYPDEVESIVADDVDEEEENLELIQATEYSRQQFVTSFLAGHHKYE